MLVPEVQDASSEIILAIHLNGIRDPRPHNSIYIHDKAYDSLNPVSR